MDIFCMRILKEANEKLAVTNISRPIFWKNTNDEGRRIHYSSAEKLCLWKTAGKCLGDSLGGVSENFACRKRILLIVSAARRTHIQLAGAKVFAEMSALAGQRPVYVYDFMRKSSGKGYRGSWSGHIVSCRSTRPQIPFFFSGSTEDDDKTAAIQQEYLAQLHSHLEIPMEKGFRKRTP